MSKIKRNKSTPQIKHPTILSQQHCPEHPSFSFVYLTKNKNYNFEFFSKQKRDRQEAQSKLTERIIQISQEPWDFWYAQSKDVGIETIPFDQINFSPNGLEMTPDEKVIVFRFASAKCRIIGVKGKLCSSCATYYVIGFDFNYSAYDHGN